MLLQRTVDAAERMKGRAGGREVSRSKEDRWLMDFLRAHHDGQLIGANTLREESGSDGRGADYGIDDEQLRVYKETNDLKAVVDRLMELTVENIPKASGLSVGQPAMAPSVIAK